MTTRDHAPPPAAAAAEPVAAAEARRVEGTAASPERALESLPLVAAVADASPAELMRTPHAGASAQRTRAVLHWQRVHGNHYVSQVLARSTVAVQRATVRVEQHAPPGGLQPDLGDLLYEWDPLRLRTYSVAQVIDDDDPDLVERLTDAQIRAATDAQRIALIGLIHRLGWVGPGDESRLELLWSAMDDFAGQASGHFTLFQQSIEYGAELGDIAPVQALKRQFERDVERQAAQYLRANLGLVLAEKERIGAHGGQPLTQPQRDSVEELQRAAGIVARALGAQGRLREIPVGIRRNRTPPPESFSQPQYVPALFDPERPPPMASLPGYLEPEVSWQQVKAQHDRLAHVISGLANRYPGVYALTKGVRGRFATRPRRRPSRHAR